MVIRITLYCFLTHKHNSMPGTPSRSGTSGTRSGPSGYHTPKPKKRKADDSQQNIMSMFKRSKPSNLVNKLCFYNRFKLPLKIITSQQIKYKDFRPAYSYIILLQDTAIL